METLYYVSMPDQLPVRISDICLHTLVNESQQNFSSSADQYKKKKKKKKKKEEEEEKMKMKKKKKCNF